MKTEPNKEDTHTTNTLIKHGNHEIMIALGPLLGKRYPSILRLLHT